MSSIARRPRDRDAEPTPPTPVHRFRVAQYHRMIEAGVLTEDDRVELLEGWIVEKMPHNPAHDGTVSLLLRRLWTRLPDGWFVRIQSAITLADSEPEPDLVVVSGSEGSYLEAHPTAGAIVLVVEVSDSSLDHDRAIKARVYARARLPECWIVNLPERRVESYSRPRAGRAPAYRVRRDYGPGEAVPIVIEGLDLGTIPILDLMPGGTPLEE